jgi:hypothetical protein
MELSVGEALVSLLDEKGRPSMVERAFILPPASRIGPITEAERRAIVESSVLFGHYEQTLDRESAYEIIKRRTSEANGGSETLAPPGRKEQAGPGSGVMDILGDMLLSKRGPRGAHQPGVLDSMARSAARSIGSQVGREIFRGVLGNIFGGRRR